MRPIALVLFLLASAAWAAESGTPSGSSYVPTDHWVYPALDRLAALGFIPSQITGLRPWTRAECLRQVAEAERLLEDADSSSPAAVEASRFVDVLRRELTAPEGSSVVLDSVSLRAGALSGKLLNDSFHFGQTRRNDFGRPFGEGANLAAGITAHAEHGRFFAAVRSEYQQAPGRDPDPLGVRETIARLDTIPLQPDLARPSVNRGRTVEAYAGVRLANLEISAGKQSLWWGPGYDAPLSFSSNAEPPQSLRVASIHPVRLPGLLRYFGQIRAEFLLGKLGGHQYTWRPWFNAQKISFKLTPDLEMGFTRWSIFWGVGHPATVGSFVRNFFSFNSPRGTAGTGPNDPGDRKAGFDFRYRLPGIRDWVTLYTDSYSDDDPSPLAAPRHASLTPGIYFTRIPGIPHLDFRVEATSTSPLGRDKGGQFVYYNNQYRSGNTNYGYLLGSPVGRDARSIQGWASYWLTPRTRIEFSYRQLKGNPLFLPGGSTQTDGIVKAWIALTAELYLDLDLQIERFRVPVLGPPQHNTGAFVSLRWEPNLPLVNR